MRKAALIGADLKEKHSNLGTVIPRIKQKKKKKFLGDSRAMWGDLRNLYFWKNKEIIMKGDNRFTCFSFGCYHNKSPQWIISPLLVYPSATPALCMSTLSMNLLCGPISSCLAASFSTSFVQYIRCLSSVHAQTSQPCRSNFSYLPNLSRLCHLQLGLSSFC